MNQQVNDDKQHFFDNEFKNNIEPELRDNFLKFYYTLNSKFSNVLFNADEEHVNDFVDMIRYHLIKNDK